MVCLWWQLAITNAPVMVGDQRAPVWALGKRIQNLKKKNILKIL
jgi:hypothetical protein